ncbi:MAG: hypothetical protein ACRD0A_17730 [Acidimicrobiales bacterium]
MTVLLDYRLSGSSDKRDRSADFARVVDMAIYYDHFTGDLIFRLDGIDFSARWRWVPILGAAILLEAIVADLTPDGASDFYEFTESIARIHFLREDDRVSISTSYAPGVAEVSYAELRRATKQFLTSVFDDFSREFPALIENPFLRDTLADRRRR